MLQERTSETDALAAEFNQRNDHPYLLSYRNGFFILLGVLVVFLSAVTFGGDVVGSQLRHQTAMLVVDTPTSESPCGNTTAEARARGCEFDLLSYSWLPQKCLDRETSAEFRDWVMSSDRRHGSWPFFTDEKLTNPVPDEDALSERTMPVFTWTTWEEHLGHCVFLGRRIQRSISGGFGVDPHQGNYEHTAHCTKEVLKGIEEDQSQNPNISYFGVLFGKC